MKADIRWPTTLNLVGDRFKAPSVERVCSRRALNWGGVLLVVVALSGCAKSHTASQPVAQPSGESRQAPVLVSMRRTERAIFQTVSIRSDGTGEVGYLIGEATGTHYFEFHLGPHQMARLRRLVDNMVRLGNGAFFGGVSPSQVVYAISARKRFVEATLGHGPVRLRALIDDLDALIDRYAGAAESSSKTSP